MVGVMVTHVMTLTLIEGPLLHGHGADEQVPEVTLL